MDDSLPERDRYLRRARLASLSAARLRARGGPDASEAAALYDEQARLSAEIADRLGEDQAS